MTWLNWFVIIIISGMLCGCDAILESRLKNASSDRAAKLIGENLDYLSGKLKIGMPKEKALALLPKPHNTDTENVCIWICDYSAKETAGRSEWRQLRLSPKDGCFLVFVNGKLATAMCACSAWDPWKALEDYAKLSSDEADRILRGPGPNK